jgi:hypothetical protein
MTDAQIFISWSLSASRVTAERAYEFLRRLFPTFKFFISSENISSGQRWFDVVSEKLNKCTIGIIVVTEENLSRPWIHYEAGALAKLVEKSRVMPLLCGVSPAAIADTPLSAFQASELSKSGMRRVADSIREHTEYGQSDGDFAEHFDMLWERHGEKLCILPPSSIEAGARPNQAKQRGPSQAEIGAQIAHLTEIVKSMEARLPSKVASEDDISKITTSLLPGSSPSDFSYLSNADLLRIIGEASSLRPTGRGLFGGGRRELPIYEAVDPNGEVGS